jgi:hypothetical protein
MKPSKSLLAASAAVSVLAAAGGANAAEVGTYSSVVITGSINGLLGSTPVTGTYSGTGTAILDSAGTLIVTDFTTSSTTAGGANTDTGTVAFAGTYAGTTFTATSGTFTTLTCGPATSSACGFLKLNTPTAFVAGSVSGAVVADPTGGVVSAETKQFGTVTVLETYTFSGFTPVVSTVPLPPAVWLLGSGLLGLVGTARRRRTA